MTINKYFFEKLGYSYVRQLNDGVWVGLAPLMFTTGLYVGMDEVGWSKRYCYEFIDEALKELKLLKISTDIPNGWVAKRPK